MFTCSVSAFHKARPLELVGTPVVLFPKPDNAVEIHQTSQENQGNHGWHHCDQVIQNILFCSSRTHQTNQVDIEAPDFKKLIDESHSDAVKDRWCNCQSHSVH